MDKSSFKKIMLLSIEKFSVGPISQFLLEKYNEKNLDQNYEKK